MSSFQLVDETVENKYRSRVTGGMMLKCGKWNNLDGLNEKAPDAWVVLHRQKNVWFWKHEIYAGHFEQSVAPTIDDWLKLLKEIPRLERERNDLKSVVAELKKKGRNNSKDADLTQDAFDAKVIEAQKALADSEKKLTRIQKRLIDTGIKMAHLLGEASESEDNSLGILLGKTTPTYNSTSIIKSGFLPLAEDWVLLRLGSDLYKNYLVTWDVNVSSPLTERSLLSLKALTSFIFSADERQLKSLQQLPDKNSSAWEQLKKYIGRLIRINLSFREPAIAEEPFLSQTPYWEPRDFSWEFLRSHAGVDYPSNLETACKVVRDMSDKDLLGKAAKEWETSQIFALWRVLPKRQHPDQSREALARVLADRISQRGDNQREVGDYLQNYHSMLEQNGMDKTAPHPLYYMIMTRRSAGAVASLVEVCEEEMLSECAEWSVFNKTYEPRVWQTLIDALSDRLTLKFHRVLYDGDAFKQARLLAENLYTMIASRLLPDNLREPYQWRLAALLRESLSRADFYIATGTETGGGAPFRKWLLHDFLPSLEFVEKNPQMRGMFPVRQEVETI